MINVILIGIDPGSRGDECPQQGADCGLLDALQHPDSYLTPALNRSKNRGLFLLQRTPPPCPFQPSPPPKTAFFFTASGCPLWPATTYTSSHSTSPDRRGSGWRATTPSRHCSVIRCTSSLFNPNSWAICWLERFNPIRYRHTIQVRRG